MGYRTVVIFNNDHLDQIKDDPDFAKKLYDAILKQNCYNTPVEIATRSKRIRASVGDVVHCSHVNRNVSLRIIDFSAHEILE